MAVGHDVEVVVAREGVQWVVLKALGAQHVGLKSRDRHGAGIRVAEAECGKDVPHRLKAHESRVGRVPVREERQCRVVANWKVGGPAVSVRRQEGVGENIRVKDRESVVSVARRISHINKITCVVGVAQELFNRQAL